MATFILTIVICTTGIFSHCNHSAYIRTRVMIHSIHGASPCWFPLLPFVPLSTYLAPSSYDRNRPPPSQVACKLTLFAPPFTQCPTLSKFPGPQLTPTAQRLITTTLGLFRSHYAEQGLWGNFVRVIPPGTEVWNPDFPKSLNIVCSVYSN
jgi:hypothetical protein